MPVRLPWGNVRAHVADVTPRAPVGLSDWSPKCGASLDAPDQIASWDSRGSVFCNWMLVKADVF